MSYVDDLAAATAAVAAAQTAVAAASSTAAEAQSALTVAQAGVASTTATLAAAQSALQHLLDNPPPPPPPVPVKHALLGMSAPADMWATRINEVGPGIQARRIFLTSFTASLTLVKTACAAGQVPVISYKVPSWSGVAAGQYDGDLRALKVSLDAIPGKKYVLLHHEPAKSGHPPIGEAGTPAQWAAMQRRALPILKSATTDTAVVLNGWMFNSNSLGYSDAELAQWLPTDVRQMLDVVAADTYQMGAGQEEPASKMRNMAAWAKRMGDVKGLGVGEFNSTTATGIADACAQLKAEPLFRFGLLWNTDLSPVTHLTGTRLTAFKSALAGWNT